MNGINTNNVHLVIVIFVKEDGLIEQALNKFNIFVYLKSNMFFAMNPLTHHDRISFIQFQPVQSQELILKD